MGILPFSGRRGFDFETIMPESSGPDPAVNQ
jgi:hypothetical protein